MIRIMAYIDCENCCNAAFDGTLDVFYSWHALSTPDYPMINFSYGEIVSFAVDCEELSVEENSY